MDPRAQFCHHSDCPARGQMGQGNIRVHSRKERRYLCTLCGKTFAETKGTPFYRLETSQSWVTLVITLLCHGCPVQAIVAAFGFDERSVTSWWLRSGKHCEEVHQHRVQQGKVDLKHVRADEIWVKVVARRMWMAMALAVPWRLGLGGVISEHRDKLLITRLIERVRSCAQRLDLLVCVDGLQSYVKAFLKGFRNPVYTGRRGRPKQVLTKGFLMGQVIKQYAKRHVVGVKYKVVQGTHQTIQAVLRATGTGKDINTSYIERLNATFRSHLAALVRRGRALAHKPLTLQAGMFVVGSAYNFCWYHASLRLQAPAGAQYKWEEQTPAMAAGLTDHRWTLFELLSYRVPLPTWVEPKRRRQRPPGVYQLEKAVTA